MYSFWGGDVLVVICFTFCFNNIKMHSLIDLWSCIFSVMLFNFLYFNFLISFYTKEKGNLISGNI